jgi:hypothetical protein
LTERTFIPIFGGQLQALSQADRANFIDVSRVDDGGMRLTGVTRGI